MTRLLIFLSLFLTIPFNLPARTWTDVKGRTIKGDLISADDQEALIRLPNGRIAKVPLIRLSDQDQAFIKESGPNTGPNSKDTPTPPAKPERNFDTPWPDRVEAGDSLEIAVISENKEEGKFIYESTNYRFLCDVRLSTSVVKGFATMFEATFLFCRSLPLGLDGDHRTNGKFQIELYETTKNYVQAGGSPNSAGCFISSRRTVLVPLTSLGVKKVGSGYMLERDVDNFVLIHELTHQLSPWAYYQKGAMGWFSEGIAEYTATTPYRNGSFKVRNNFKEIVRFATSSNSRNTGRYLGKTIIAPPLSKFFHLDYADFVGRSTPGNQNVNFNYGWSLLLTTYFIHLDDAKDPKRLKNFLKALHEGKSGEEAVKHLLDGRSYRQLEEDIAAAWKKKGLDITFQE